MIAITTIAPTTIHSHGTVLVVVLVVVVDESGLVAVVVVVLEPAALPAVCAYVIAGAIARNSASRMKLSRKIGRMWFPPSNLTMYGLLAQENAF
jgi:hypothetical protein